MRLDDTDEIFFLVKRKIDSDPYVKTSPPMVYNFIDKSPFFGKERASASVVDLLMQFRAGYGLIILNRKAYWLRETTLMPCRTFHRRIGDAIFPNISRIHREEIIAKIGMEKIDFSRWSAFQDEDDLIDEIIDKERSNLINYLRRLHSKEISKDWKRGEKTLWIEEKLINMGKTDFTDTEKAEILHSSQQTISRISRRLRKEGLVV